MSHVRAQIRERMRVLITAIAGLETSVEIDSEKIPEDPEAPFVHVLLGNEIIDQIGLGGPNGRKNSRELELIADIYCSAKSEALLLAEEYAVSIEAKVAADPRLGGLTSNISLRSYQIERSLEGRKPIVRLRLQWAAIYFTNERDATVPA